MSWREYVPTSRYVVKSRSPPRANGARARSQNPLHFRIWIGVPVLPKPCICVFAAAIAKQSAGASRRRLSRRLACAQSRRINWPRILRFAPCAHHHIAILLMPEALVENGNAESLLLVPGPTSGWNLNVLRAIVRFSVWAALPAMACSLVGATERAERPCATGSARPLGIVRCAPPMERLRVDPRARRDISPWGSTDALPAQPDEGALPARLRLDGGYGQNTPHMH